MSAVPREDEAVLETLLEEVGTEAGLTFEPHRREMVRDSLDRVRSLRGFSSLQDLLQAVRSQEEVRTEVMSALTIGETYFFREPAQFELLRETIIPNRLKAQGAGAKLHMWSVGCATGEEPYSLAILLEELGEAEDAFLFASDIDEIALTRARRGVYRPWAFRDVPDDVRARYFVRDGTEYRLQARFLERVVFFPFNLASPDARRLWLGLWGLDVVLMRNVLIYFTPDAQRAAYQRVTNALAPGGWLLLGASDPPPPEDLPLEVVRTSAGQVYRRVIDEGAFEDLSPPIERASTRALSSGKLTSLVAPAPRSRSPQTPRLDELFDFASAHGADLALAKVAGAIETEPLDVELRYARALLSLEARRPKDAAEALRQVVYLDRTLPEAHFLMALVHAKTGDRQSALRCLDNADELLRDRDDAEPIRFGRGETVGALRVASARARRRLSSGGGPHA